jgi:copper transport protein
VRLRRTRLGRMPALLAACAFLALAAAPPALAHAELLKTEPSNDAVVERPPARVSVRFNEAVETSFGAIRVYDAGAKRVDAGDVERPSSREVATSLDARLPRGTYTVTWRIVSADGHPLSGAFVFHVERPGARPAGVAAEVLDDDSPPSVQVGFTVVRFLDFGLILLAAGGSIVLALALGTANAAVRRKLWSVLAAAALLLVPVALAGIVFQGAAAGGFGLEEALRWDVVSAVADTRFGQVWLVQALVAVLLAGVALVRRRQAGDSPLDEVALLLAAALIVTPASSGHAGTAGTFQYLLDVVHVQAAAAWTGGLAFVVMALLWAGRSRWELAATAVPRFSTIAVVSVSALLVAGVIGGYLQVRAWRGLWETTYGLLLLGKVALVLPLLALGAYNNRFLVRRLRDAVASPREQRRFLRTTGAELALMAAIVGVTAALVAEPPAKAEVAPRGPFSTFTELGSLELNLVVDPAVAGANDVHLYLTDQTGRPTGLAAANVSAQLPSRSVGPLRLRALSAGPGHLIVRQAHFALPGDWQLTVEARRGEFESLRRSISVPIRKE